MAALTVSAAQAADFAETDVCRTSPPLSPTTAFAPISKQRVVELPYGDSQQFQLLPNPEGVLNYRMAPATSEMVLLVNPEVTLYFSIDNRDDADFELTVKDVDPEGNITFLQSGLPRASLRAIDEKQTHEDEVLSLYTKNEKLVPGQIYKIRMTLLSPIAHVVRQGLSLELTIGAPNPMPHVLIGSIPANATSVNRGYHSEKYPSTSSFPLYQERGPQSCAAMPHAPWSALPKSNDVGSRWTTNPVTLLPASCLI